jgi:GGDEF domain-containing protein
MQSVLMAAAQAVSLDTPYDAVFVPLVDDLVDALAADEPATFLRAVEGRSRLLATERSVRMADVFVGLQLGLGAFRGALSGASPDEALAARRLAAIEGEVLLRAGVGFSEGLEATVDHLSRKVATLAPTDPDTGLSNAAELSRRLAVEIERCRRTDVSLGAVLVAIAADGDARRPAADDLVALVADSGRLLAAGLRRYDVAGRLGELELLAVLPDVSRRGVQAVVERLRRELPRQCSPRRRIGFRFVATHLDVVDVFADDLLAQLTAALADGRAGDGGVVWL